MVSSPVFGGRRASLSATAILAAGCTALSLPSIVHAQGHVGIGGSGLHSRAVVETLRSLVPGCPDRGGILDSISVPVGEPLSLVVIIFSPAPPGGATFQLSSDDPLVVAAGDRRQGFLPRVFIPEGQTVSNPFTIFGTNVGATRLRLIPLTAGFLPSSFPLGAWDVNRKGTEKFVDANPRTNHCRVDESSSDLSTDPTVLSQCGSSIRHGVAADGVTRLLMRTISGLPGTVCYEITSASALDQGTLEAQVLSTQTVGNLEYGFTFYKAPDFFGETSPFRTLEVEFTFTPSIGNGNTSRFRAQTKIVRPPVVLLHGDLERRGRVGRGLQEGRRLSHHLPGRLTKPPTATASPTTSRASGISRNARSTRPATRALP